MLWMLAGAALGAVSTIGNARMQQAQQEANNKAIAAYNKQTMLSAAKSFSELSVQKAVLATQYQTALASVQQQGLAKSSQVQAQAAASDTMGASVSQSVLDVQSQVDTAQDQLKYNENISDQQINAQAESVATSAGQALQTQQPVNSWTSSLGSILGSVGTQLATNKANTGSFFQSRSLS